MSHKPTDEEIEIFRKTVDGMGRQRHKLSTIVDVNFLPKPETAEFLKVSDVRGEQTLSFKRPDISDEALKQLKHGKLHIERRLDLHDLSLVQATDAMAQTLQQCHDNTEHCLLLIHGKGRNSKSSRPMLKAWVNYWLAEHPLVQAFHSALQPHGGTGALYVLVS